MNSILFFSFVLSSTAIAHPLSDQRLPSSSSAILDSVPIGTEIYNFPSYITGTKNSLVNAGVFFQCKSTIREVNFPSDSQLVEIGDFTFQFCTLIKTITIPKSVTRIGVRAFHGTSSLKEFKFSDFSNSALDKIELSAFENCKLTSFGIPKRVTFLGPTIFSFTPIVHLLIPNSVVTLSGHSFFAMNYVQTIEFEEKAKIVEFPANSFAQCFSLTKVSIPSSLTTISTDNVFTDSVNISFFQVSSENSVFSNDNDGILYSYDKKTIITVPPCFSSNNKEEFRIPEGITKLGGLSFNNILNLKKIVLSSTISTIEEGAFTSCVSLISIDVSLNNHFTVDSQGALIRINQRCIIHFPIESSLQKYIVEEGTVSIGKGAFKRSKNLEIVEIKSTVLSLFNIAAFEECLNLKSVIGIPPSLKTIGPNVFSGCVQLSEFDLQRSSIQYLSGYSFYKCQISFNSLPTSLLTLGHYSFYDNSRLTNVVIPNGCQISILPQNIFSNCRNLETISIQTNTITKIDSNAFTACSSLNNVVIPPSVKKLIGAVFMLCTSLTKIDLPDTLELIGGNCFKNCSSMREITIKGPTIIESYAFDGCSTLDTVHFSQKVAEIKNTAFFICQNLERFIMDPNNVDYCSVDGVLYSKNMKVLVAYPPGNSSQSFSIPESVVSVDYVAFYGSQKLRYLNIPLGVQEFKFNAFENCNSLYCGSVKYSPDQKQKLLDAKMKKEALTPCPTAVFTHHSLPSLGISGIFRILSFSFITLF